MTNEEFSSDDGRESDREFDTTSGGLNDETAVSVRAARSAAQPAAPGSFADGPADGAAIGEDTAATVRVDRAPRPAVPRYSAPPEMPDDTVVRPRGSRVAEEATIRVRRTVSEPDPAAAPDEHTADDPQAEAEASTVEPLTRAAYTPDPAELAKGYAARPAAPVIATRAAHPMRMAQPAIDGEAVDRSIRGKARRRAASLGAAVAFSVVVVACLLVALIASFTQ